MDWYYAVGNFAFIPLHGDNGEGKVTRVDLEDIDEIGEHSTRWNLSREDGYPYAWSKVLKGMVSLHVLLCPDDCGPGEDVDHEDEDKLNNSKSNLRVLSRADNMRNREIKTMNGKPTSSRYPGVYWDKARGKWRAQASVDGKNVHLGYHKDERDAARAYRNFLRGISPMIKRPQWEELDDVAPGQTTIMNFFGPANVYQK